MSNPSRMLSVCPTDNNENNATPQADRRNRMLAKLTLIIIAAGATACALLVNRQHRIDTVNEMTAVHQRIVEQEQSLWRLRREITRHTRPDQIKGHVDARGGTWVAIADEPVKDSTHLVAVDMEPNGG